MPAAAPAPVDRDSIEHRPPLGAHRLLGQGRGAALIRPDGEVDWWCPNRFDAAPLLWSLLDPRGGRARWLGAEQAAYDPCPAGPVAHTIVRIGGRRAELWDGLVSIDSGSALVRLVRSEAGAMTVTHELSAGGFDAPWQRWPAGEVVRTRIDAVATAWSGFAIVVARDTSADIVQASVEGLDLERLLEDAEADDRASMQNVRLPYHHPSRVTDALRVLHALTDEKTGAPVAAPTTSLPEAPGGTRQFDYRFTWLRDSANAVAAASLLGHRHASERYLAFVCSLVDRTGDHLTPLTTTSGDPVPAERVVPGVSGWAASTPIRVGNAASGQRQLDAVAAVIEAVWLHLLCGGRMRASSWQLVDRLANLLVAAPPGPTSGVWELREPQDLVSEEVARWIGMDRALTVKRVLRPWVRRPEWRRMRADARARVEAALDPTTGMLPHAFGEQPVVPDAAALLAALNGFFDRNDPRLARLVRSTIAALEESPFLRRRPVGEGSTFSGREGAFLPASWWAVSALCAIGDLPAAERRADEMCAHLPPLVPEEWDVERDEGLGNTPLLWSHTEAARALYNLHALRLRVRFGPPGAALWRLARFLRLRFSGR